MIRKRKQGQLLGSEGRLFRGYGPILCLVAAFLVVSIVAPTVAPQRIIVSKTTSSGATANKSSGAANPAAGSTATSTVSAGGGQSGTSASPLGKAASCAGLQVPNDAYSPPCTTWSGDNGGATTLGVTGSTITVALRQTDIMDVATLVSQLTGHQVQGGASVADDIRTYQVIADYFNAHFQFYGRKLKIVVYQGQGSPSTEIFGGGQANATADAIDEAQQLHAFADVSFEAPVFAQALVGQKILAINPIYPSIQWFAQNSPYAWGVWPDCTTLAKTVVDLALKSLKGQPANYAGGSLKGQPRKVGLIYPDSPAMASCGTYANQQLAAGGMAVADSRSYPLDVSTVQQSAQTISSAFASEGITTVLDLADPVTTFFMTNYAHEQNWTPEWVENGAGFTDTDWAGQLFNQAEWSHAFGPSTLGTPKPARGTFAYGAYESMSPSTTPAESDLSWVYEDLDLLAIAIQMAGPDLTPQTFATGLRSYQSPGVGEDGKWAFPTGTFTAPQDARIVWWAPSATSIFNGAQGAYQDNAMRYPIGGFPSGSPPVFLKGGP